MERDPLNPEDLPPDLLEALRAEAPPGTRGDQLEELTALEQAMEAGDLDALWVIARDRQARALRARIFLPIVIGLVVVACALGVVIALSTLLYR